MPRIYIAGPMTGLPECNYPAFHAAAAAWRAKGWDVENPAEHFGGAQDRSYVEYVHADVPGLAECDAMAMLPNWDAGHSGAIWEHAIAVHLLKIPVYDATHPVAPWAPDADPRAGEILVANYDEWREFQAWRLNRARFKTDPQEWRGVCGEIPITRHPVTGALGRWVL